MQKDQAVSILMVDDHPENLISLEAILQRPDYNLVKASSGEQALRHLLQQDFAVILLDIHMPRINGFETMALIKERERSRFTPIIFLTATSKSDTDIFEGYLNGAVDFIFKPVIPNVLKAKVGVFVDLFKKTKEVEHLRHLEQLKHADERAQTLEALQRKEQQYRLLFENNPQPMWVYDLTTLAFLAVNGAAVEHYGYSQAEFLNMTVKDIRPVEEIPLLLEYVANARQRQSVSKQVKHRKKDGSVIEVEVTSHSIIFEGNQARFVMAHDITEKKNLENQFLRAQRMESLGTLASGIAHDLNNVLTPIIMSMQLLKRQHPDERGQRILSTLEATAQRGANLVKQVLSFGRGLEANKTVVQLKHLILEIEKVAQQTFPKSIAIQTEISPDLWTIAGDPTQLHQVLMNLCVNARDAMSNGGRFTITANNFFIDKNYAQMHIDAQIGPYIVISVFDTGTGIPPGIIEKIFDPFFTTKEIGKGTGLGLSTVIGIVKSHGGFVNVYSEIHKGTQFKIFLPAIDSTETEQTRASQEELPVGKGELILVVDDESAICEITKSSLEAYDYQVLTANDGTEAITLYIQNQHQIRVVLTDMNMPIMDGSATIRALKKINPGIKIIAATGLTSNYSEIEAAQLGVYSFLQKPYTADQLLTLLSVVINQPV